MTKNKHDHTATKKIKAWLLAIMLLLPFLFLLPTGLYYGLNQNAQLSERIEQQPVYYESNEVNSVDDIVLGNIYQFSNTNFIYTTNTTIYCDYLQIISGNYTQYAYEAINSNYPYFRCQINGYTIRVYFDENNIGYINNFTLLFVPNNLTDFNSNLIPLISETNIQVVKEYTPVVYNNDISTSIINAWNSTWQNPLFSWTNYSPFYAPMQSFTNTFGINDMQIANVLTYLATITAIYIVFDIVIELFTYLTHLIPRSD